MGMYYGVPRSVVVKFTMMCPTCQLRQPQQTRAPLKPIIANGFMSRLQVELMQRSSEMVLSFLMYSIVVINRLSTLHAIAGNFPYLD